MHMSSSIAVRRVLIGGASGFIGRALTAHLRQAGCEVIGVSRQRRAGFITWDDVCSAGLPDGIDAVISLSGANLLSRSWSSANNRQYLIESRTEPLRSLLQAMARRARAGQRGPSVVAVASGAGVYAPSDTMVHTEASQALNTGFPGQLAQAVEAIVATTALPPELTGVRTVPLRLGVVLGPDGGMMQGLVPATYFTGGSVVGPGSQYLPWIHVEDAARLFHHVLSTPGLQGPVNAVADSSTYSDIAHTLARIMHRPCIWRVPAFVLRATLGDRAALLLDSLRVASERAQQTGFRFQFGTVEAALRRVVAVSSFGDSRSASATGRRAEESRPPSERD